MNILSRGAELSGGAILAVQGGELRVDHALWTNAAVEIIACPGLMARALELLIPNAAAHGEAAPTRSATPTVQSGLSDGPVELGRLAPPAAAYCSVKYHLGPADADAVGIDAAPEMMGRSVLVRGAFRQAQGVWQDFEMVSTSEMEVVIADVSFDLSERGATATLSIERDLSSWWPGLAFEATASSIEREGTLLRNIESSIRVHVE